MQRRGELPSLTEKNDNTKQVLAGGRKKPGGGKVVSSSKHLATQLLEAVRLEKPRIVKRLLDNKISCGVTNEYGETPLHLACATAGEEARGKMASQLLAYGCDVNALDRDGRTALMRAVEKGDGDLVRLLLENQSDAGVEDSQGDTALFYAARGGKPDIVRRLVREARRAKRDIDHKNMRGLTALLVAAREGHVDASRILAEEGNASLTVRDLDNFMTAEEWLLDAGYGEDEASFLSPKTRRRNRHRKVVKTLSEYIAEEKESRPFGRSSKSGPIPSVFGERGRVNTLHYSSQSNSSEQQRKSSMFDFPSVGGTRKKSSTQNPFSLTQQRMHGGDMATHKHGLFNSPYLARRNSFVSPNRTSQYYTEGALEPISSVDKHQIATATSSSLPSRPTLSRTHSIDEGAQSEFSQQPTLPPLRSTQQHKQ